MADGCSDKRRRRHAIYKVNGIKCFLYSTLARQIEGRQENVSIHGVEGDFGI